MYKSTCGTPQVPLSENKNNPVTVNKNKVKENEREKKERKKL